ncbi:hypothetical protein D3C76_843700 [compost metagenome]
MTSDPVVQHIDLNALRRFFQQQGLQLPADFIVVNDEELNKHRIGRPPYGFEDCGEGSVTIDQQAHFVVGQTWHAPQLRHGAQ